MVVRKLSLPEITAALKESIAYGKANYALFLLVVLIKTISSALLQLIPGIGVIVDLLVDAYLFAGVLLIAQTVEQKKKDPSLGQLFIGFRESDLMERMIPYAVVILVVTLVAVIPPLLFTMAIPTLAKTLSLSPYVFSVLTILLNIGVQVLGLVLTLFFGAYYVLRTLPWHVALKQSIMGSTRNPFVIFLYMISTVIIFAVSSLGYHYIFKMIAIIVGPFFLLLSYRLYVRIFRFPTPDEQLQDLEEG
jgi:hypothetical protein